MNTIKISNSLLPVLIMAICSFLGVANVSANPMKIFGGEWASLYINDLGDLYFTGDVGWDGGTSTTLPPKLLMSSVKDASNGSGQTLIVKFDDSLWVMGRNDFGQLGTGNTNALTSPVKIADGVKAVSAGTWHSLYLTTGGVAMAMGRNNYPFGDGSTAHRYSPVQIMTGVKAISAGVRHSLYLKEDGTAWAVGSNWEGALGDGTTNVRSTPYQVMSNVVAISAGDNYSMFVKTDGSVWVCGKGQDGRLGTGNTSNQFYPVQVMAGCVDAFAERGYYNSTTWFLKSDGNVYACGYNASGQIGDGTTSDRLSPVKVAVANNVRSISRGLFLTLEGWVVATGSHSVGSMNPNQKTIIDLSPSAPLETQYSLIQGSFTWAEAKVDAQSRGGRLAILNTQDKVNTANAYLMSLPTMPVWEMVWIGLTDEVTEGQWKWISGEALTFSNWEPGEPNNSGDEDYAGIYPNATYNWNDSANFSINPYLLEILRPIITTQPIGASVAFGASTTLSVVATADGTPTYQWRKNGVDIPNATTANLALNNVQMTDAGSYTVVITLGNSVTSNAAVITVTAPVSWTLFNAAETALAVADTGLVTLSPIEKISVVTGAAAHAAGNALMLQAVDGGSTYAERTIQGPAVVTFAWRVSSEEGFDFFSYSLDGDEQESISGNGAWLERSLLLDTGTHTLRWTYAKDSADANFDDAGYLDDLVVLPAFEDLQVKSGSTVLTGNSTLSFGTVQEQATALTQTLDLKNTGTIQMAVSASLPVDSGFVFEDQTLSAALVLEPGATQALRVVLKTTVPGTKSALLTLTAAGSQTPPPAITLSGIVQPLTPAITCSWSGGGLTNGQGTAVDFGTTPSDLTFTVNNTGTGALAIASVSVSPSADFQVIYPPATTVAIGGNTTFTLRASETTRGTHSATVTIASNAGNAPSFSFPVTSFSYLAVTGTGYTNGSFTNTGTSAGWSTAALALPGGGTGQVLKAGVTPNGGHSTIGATFEGPGLLRWNWQTSTQANYDWLVCEVNGAEVAGISTKNAAWQSQVVQIPAGAVVRWIYRKDAANTAGSDTGYISDISFNKFTAPQITFADWSAARGDLAPLQPLHPLGLQAMFAWLGGLDPEAAPAADHYTPMVSGGVYKYRYRVAKSAAGRMHAEISNDLVNWSKRKMSQTLISEDANSAVIEVSAPTTTAVFSRLVAEQPASSMPDPSAFSLIPAGAFMMGNSIAADTDITDAPVRTVTLDAYYIGKYEVTKAEWDEVRTWALSNGYTDLAAGSGKASNHPVHSVTWYEVVKWCNARSQKEGLTPVYYINDAQTTIYKGGNFDVTNAQVKWTANGYRLPTEAEWEKAARGGLSGKRFPWGDTISHSQANYSADSAFTYDLSGVTSYHPNYATGAEPYTSPVGAFTASGYSLYDIVGNVFEWCWDWYGTYAAGSQTNPRGFTSGTERVRRGDGWHNDPGLARVARRISFYPGSPNGDLGFRVARSTGPRIYPTISEIADQSIIPGNNTGALAFTVNDAQTAASFLTLSGSSGNTTLVPTANIVFGGSGANRTVTVTPASGQTGTATITITVSDGSLTSSDTFELTVRPALTLVNGGQLPASSSLPYQSVATFYIAKTEATLGEWQSVLAYALANGYGLPAGGGSGSVYPVTNVSWYDAVKWCNARSEQEGLRPVYIVNGAVYKAGQSAPEVNSTANGYRLPTEAEWEFAARGGVSSLGYVYSGSNDINAVAWYGDNASTGARPVATKQANQLGLSDMSGNAREWCENWNPSNASHRIVRGGSWGYADFLCKVDYRNSHAPDYSVNFVGFRVARSAVP